MEIYLIRHTAPDVAKGICYGQADVGVKETFLAEAGIIKKHLPPYIKTVYSSPLQRCKLLAQHLFASHKINLHEGLKEINCGAWELKAWNDLPKEEVEPWVNNLSVRMPQGESYEDVYERVKHTFQHIHTQPAPMAIVAHGGVIRSILAHITNTALKDSFKVFSLNYGCVIKIENTAEGLRHIVLSNIAGEKETHKPSNL